MRIIGTIFGCIHLLIFSIFCTISFIDLIYYYPVANGTSASILYSLAWWCILIFVIINYLLPILLIMATTAGTVELHFVFSNFVNVMNFIALVLCIICYFLYMNTSYSGGFPFNDPKWCCRYYMDQPELCPNTSFCTDDPVSLYANAQFVIIWIFTGVFFILSFVNLGISQLLRKSEDIPPPTRKELVGMGLVVAGIYFILFIYWCAFPLLDTQFLFGYPTLGVPPGPGDFVNYRYPYWQWWFVWFMIANIFPPLIFLGTLLFEEPSILVTGVHFWSSIIIGVITSACFIVFLGILIFDCNYGWSGASLCNSNLWCCIYFAGSYDICGNVTPCPGNVNLYPNGQFVQHLVFSLLFAAGGYMMVYVNERFVKAGIYK